MIMFLRVVIGVIAGLALAFVLVIGVELFSAVVHPFPEGFEGTEEEICAHVEKYPGWVLAVVVPMWALILFSSTWVSRKIGGLVASLLVGSLLLIAVGFNQWMLPYPIWFEVANFVALPLAMLGAIQINRTKVETLLNESGDAENLSR
ncbi:hypothetical protein C5Y96_26295 [Blastopirellula marina]|uniref:Uncharacterized protein n=1 Tax=Blastopirellula marina TaxID=124 RepID=A0A2S8EYM3_9BACT|nr:MULTISPECIES: hypothetical protein [Pirellulaceae]PQO25018.1 hypothetical protein C5Y96_26295 [Blastopirellula marina]RCS40870.1 hypothetical protein DTL36_26345 [Bremerella cremea]